MEPEPESEPEPEPEPKPEPEPESEPESELEPEPESELEPEPESELEPEPEPEPEPELEPKPEPKPESESESEPESKPESKPEPEPESEPETEPIVEEVTKEKKLALVIGINYYGTDNALRGCCNDAKNVAFFMAQKGYDVIKITDEADSFCSPTRNNILYCIQYLVEKCGNENIKKVWVSFSGHGYYINDTSNDEVDGKDEVIITSDSYIKDDELFQYLVNPLLELGVKMYDLV